MSVQRKSKTEEGRIAALTAARRGPFAKGTGKSEQHPDRQAREKSKHREKGCSLPSMQGSANKNKHTKRRKGRSLPSTQGSTHKNQSGRIRA